MTHDIDLKEHTKNYHNLVYKIVIIDILDILVSQLEKFTDLTSFDTSNELCDKIIKELQKKYNITVK